MQAAQTSSDPNASLYNQVDSNSAAVQDSVQPVVAPLRGPVPRPRQGTPTYINVAPAAPVTPAPNPVSVPANPSPPADLQSDDPDDM